MFGLRIVRHRYFEIEGFTVLQPKHEKHKLSVMDGTAVACYSGGINPGFWGDKEKQKAYRKKRSYYAQVAAMSGDSYSFKIEDWKNAMGVYHINKRNHLTQAVPPKYSEYICNYFN